ncbi:MAG: hypothetical protein EAZ57_06075 [Cytophagales bacterium]|nr:MAG: hypothetical protein EAZ67_08265 [Cytophagales bacterium]TAF60749.1 MAG: hypothetical protein EAZ57_06075 [Cytophagales bacterium]
MRSHDILSLSRFVFFVTLFCGLFGSLAAQGQSLPDSIILNVDGRAISWAEFEFYYRKNNPVKDEAKLWSEKNVREYLDLFTKFKLKVQDGLNQKLDTFTSFKEEFETYRKDLVKPYLVEKSVTDRLVNEAYARLQEEIRASHILIALTPFASPQDTLRAYNRIKDIRKNAEAGQDFRELAYSYSEDPTAKTNRGDLGYFTALQMVYEFENMAYETPVNQVSPIFRTQYGYHILKVNQRLKASGSTKLAHIMIRAAEGMTAEDSLTAAQKISEIYTRLRNNEEWAGLCSQFSDDLKSRESGGEMAWRSTGTMLPEFEEAAFELRKKGDISSPVRTAFGWHILKLVDRKPLEPFDEIKNTLREKVLKDSRANLQEGEFLARIRKEYKFVEQVKNRKFVNSGLDSLLLDGKWKYSPKLKTLKKVLFSCNDKDYNLEDFYKYAQAEQLPQNQGTVQSYGTQLYEKYQKKVVLGIEESRLPFKNKEFSMLLREYYEGIILFSLMQKNIWNKSIEDENALKAYFEANRSNYEWKERVTATIFSCANDSVKSVVESAFAEGYYRSDEPETDIALYYNENNPKVLADQSAMITKLASHCRQSDSHIILLNQINAPKDKMEIHLKRISDLKDQLVKLNVKEKQIVDKIDTIADMKKLAKAKRVGIIYLKAGYNTTNDNLLKRLNKTNPLNLNVQTSTFERGESKLLDQIPQWVLGRTVFQENGRVQIVQIDRIENARFKELNEIRGAVMSDFQIYLENEWNKALAEKYAVKVNEELLKRMTK